MLSKICRVGILSAALFALTLSIPSISRAQDTLKYGDTVAGELTATGKQPEYSFTAAKADLVIIDARQAQSSPLLPALEVLSAKGNIVANNETGFAGTLSRIVFEVPSDGTYTIRVIANKRADDKGKVGGFTLTAH